MHTVSDDTLPWAVPYTQTLSGVSFHSVPSINSRVRVVSLDPSLSRFAYLPFSESSYNEYQYEAVDGQEYPEPTYLASQDGSTKVYINSTTNEAGLLANNIKIILKNNVLSLEADNIEMNATDIKLDLDGTYQSLKSLLNKLLGHLHQSAVGPTTPPLDSQQTPLLIEKTPA